MSIAIKSLINGKFILATGTVICAIVLLVFSLAKRNKDYHTKAFEMVNYMIKSFSDNKTERIDSEKNSE
jgi:predicted small secreted protein